MLPFTDSTRSIPKGVVMGQEIDYAAVLADLETRRALLDATIAGIRAMMLGQGPAGELPQLPSANKSLTPSTTRQESQEISAGMFHGMSAAEAAKKYLGMRRTKQRTKDIVEAIQRGGIESTAKNFYSNLYTTLMRDKDFIKIGKHWALAEWYPTRSSTAQEKPAKQARKARKVRSQKVAPTPPAGGENK